MAGFLLVTTCVLAWLSLARGDEDIRLRNANGMQVDINPTGACIRRLLLPAADGGPPVDVMMGFEQQDVDKYRVRARHISTACINTFCMMEWEAEGAGERLGRSGGSLPPPPIPLAPASLQACPG